MRVGYREEWIRRERKGYGGRVTKGPEVKLRKGRIRRGRKYKQWLKRVGWRKEDK